MPMVSVHFFAGGSAYAMAFGNRIRIIEAYAKAQGNLDVQECINRFNGEEADEDKNVVRFGALIYLLGRTYSAGFEKELCAHGNPCLAKVSS